MKHFMKSDQRGFGHMGLIVAVVVVLALGGVGWFVYNRNKDGATSSADKALQEALANAKCDYDDEDLCKFFTSWKAQNSYTVNTVSEVDGKKSTMVLQAEGDNKSHIKLTGDVSYEMIVIGDATYTKAADGTWWKQATASDQPASAAADVREDANVDFAEPESTEQAKTAYKKIGKEKCGELTCFKYQELGTEGTTSYIWFDDKDYQLRRTQTTSDGTTSDSTFSYNKVSIKEPSPVKELGPNQYLIPGQSEPTTLPTTGDMPSEAELEQLMQQYGG